MSYLSQVLDEVRDAQAPPDAVLKAARERREAVLAIANDFDGARKKVRSGSIAHRTANSDLDADCAIVLDRRSYPDLGPDSDAGDGPTDIVGDLREHVRERLAEEYPDVRAYLNNKRAIQFRFYDPIEGFDPNVELVAAIGRRDDPGIWIPNLDKDEWNASHPEKHTQLFASGSLRRVRTWGRVVRLAKGWNSCPSKPAVCSFNLEVLAWECIEDDMTISEALDELFRYGAKELANALTNDPADVSPPIKLLLPKEDVVRRFEDASELMTRALDDEDDEDEVTDSMSKLFPDFVTATESQQSKASFADSIRRGQPLSIGATGLTAGSAGGTLIKRHRSAGDQRDGH